MIKDNDQSRPSNLDYLETTRGDLFVVIGEQHPRDRIFSYLKYIPKGPVTEPDNEWHRDGIRYKRVLPYYHYSYISENLGFYRNFLFDCPVNDITMTAIPLKAIKKYYKPRERFEELYLQSSGKRDKDKQVLDRLEVKVLELVTILAEMSSIQPYAFGVTGSILLGIHNPAFSDIDLTVYGRSNALALRKFLFETLKSPCKGISPISEDVLENSARKQAKLYQITEEQALYILKRRWNHQTFRGTRFSVHPVIPRVNNYGNVLYRNIGSIYLTGTVIDRSEGLYYPPCWKLETTSSSIPTISGGEKIDLTSFEGFYNDIFSEGDSIEVHGKLENVINSSGDLLGHRVVVGGSDNSKILFLG